MKKAPTYSIVEKSFQDGTCEYYIKINKFDWWCHCYMSGYSMIGRGIYGQVGRCYTKIHRDAVAYKTKKEAETRIAELWKRWPASQPLRTQEYSVDPEGLGV